MRVAVIDSHLANLSSVVDALSQVGGDPVVIESPSDLADAEAVVLPGVGSFPAGMHELTSRGFDDAILAAHRRGAWMLGICLGMQLFMESGTEGGPHPGLGLIPGSVRHLGHWDSNARTPNIGWRRVEWVPESVLAPESGDREYFYFMHGYAVDPIEPDHVCGTVAFGGNSVPAAIRHDRVLGVQFHPEKSQLAGLRVLERFCSLAGVTQPS